MRNDSTIDNTVQVLYYQYINLYCIIYDSTGQFEGGECLEDASSLTAARFERFEGTSTWQLRDRL